MVDNYPIKCNIPYGKERFILILVVIFCFNACEKKKSEAPLRSKISYYIENYEFQNALDIVRKGDYSQSDIPSIVELYYLLTRISYAAYHNTLILYEIGFEDYLSRSDDQHPELIPAIRYFLGRSYLLSGHDDKAEPYFNRLARTFSREHNLYPRIALISGSLRSPIKKPPKTIISQEPLLSTRLGFKFLENREDIFKVPIRQFSLEALDRAMIALDEDNYTYLDQVLQDPLSASFYYEVLVDDSLNIRTYDPESLYLRVHYFAHKAKTFAEQLGDQSLKAFYKGWISYYQDDYQETAKQFGFLKNSDVFDEADNNSIAAVVRVFSADNSFDDYYEPASVQIDDYVNLKPAVTYWFHRWWNQRENRGTEDFFTRVDEAFSPLLSSGESHIPKRLEECDFRELLFMIGRYFVLNREVKKSEKYFAALYKLTNSFDLKYNTPCGLTYAYHPVVALAYAGTSLIHSIDLKQLVLTSIDMEIVRTPLFREPADVLKVIHAAREGKGGVRH